MSGERAPVVVVRPAARGDEHRTVAVVWHAAPGLPAVRAWVHVHRTDGVPTIQLAHADPSVELQGRPLGLPCAANLVELLTGMLGTRRGEVLDDAVILERARNNALVLLLGVELTAPAPIDRVTSLAGGPTS